MRNFQSFIAILHGLGAVALPICPVLAEPPGTSFTRQADWQVANGCRVAFVRIPSDQEEKAVKCTGLHITEMKGLNIHFSIGDPYSNGKVIASYVVPAGFRQGPLPVSHIVFYLGTPEQMAVPVKNGSCNLVPATTKASAALIQCRGTIPSRVNGQEDLYVIGSAFFDPISSAIRSRF